MVPRTPVPGVDDLDSKIVSGAIVEELLQPARKAVLERNLLCMGERIAEHENPPHPQRFGLQVPTSCKPRLLCRTQVSNSP